MWFTDKRQWQADLTILSLKRISVQFAESYPQVFMTWITQVMEKSIIVIYIKTSYPESSISSYATLDFELRSSSSRAASLIKRDDSNDFRSSVK